MPGFGKGNKYMHKFEKDSKRLYSVCTIGCLKCLVSYRRGFYPHYASSQLKIKHKDFLYKL